MGFGELGSTAYDWVREDFTKEQVFVISVNKQGKDKLRRSGDRAIQEESIADMVGFRWEHAWWVEEQPKRPIVGESNEQGKIGERQTRGNSSLATWEIPGQASSPMKQE